MAKRDCRSVEFNDVKLCVDEVLKIHDILDNVLSYCCNACNEPIEQQHLTNYKGFSLAVAYFIMNEGYCKMFY